MSSAYLCQKINENIGKMNGITAEIATLSTETTQFCPPNTVPLDNQVAGHSGIDGKSPMGMLLHKDGYVLKPVNKPKQAETEIRFYEELQHATDPTSVELRKFVPEYLGTTSVPVNGRDIKCVILKNATEGFVEPCIMDIKIGSQTWEPEASEEKKKCEQKKYTESKRELGFCIPGFQVYRISSGKLLKMGKEYGKKLNKSSIKDALKLYLNSDSGLSRHLILHFLARLWSILNWCRSQKRYRFYASSLLLVYDARKLRQILKAEQSILNHHNQSIVRPPTLHLSPSAPSLTNMSRLSPDQSPSYKKSKFYSSAPSTVPQIKQNGHLRENGWHPIIAKVSRTHSFTNNYERDLQNMKEEYSFQLEDLVNADQPGNREIWATIKMIDFAHAFTVTSDEPDNNYMEGINSLVNLFESLLEEVSVGKIYAV